jgi:phosphatidyl-myo-inositol dimannoside synthase
MSAAPAETERAPAEMPGRLGRVLMVASSFPRWAGDSSGPFVLNLAQDLQRCGWAVDVLAPHAPGAVCREDMGGVGVERFRYWWPSRFETLCYGGGVLGNLRRNRLNAVKVPPLVLAEWLALMRLLARRRYDIVHSHWLLPQGLVASLAARLSRARHVTTVHGSEVLDLRGRMVAAFERVALRGAAAVTVNSPATRAAVEAIAPGLGDLHTIPMGIAVDRMPDADAAARIRAAHRRGSGPLLAFVGRLIPEKGVGDLIEAVALLAPRFPDLTVLLVGDGSGRDGFESLARERGVADRLSFVGPVAPADVYDHMAAADLFVGPSWHESFGLVFAEALHLGLPVVAAEVGGVVETVVHEETGLLVPPRAPEAIAAAVERIVRDPERARAMAAAGKAVVSRRLSRPAVAAAFSSLFEGLRHASRDDALGRREAAAR